MVGLRAKGKAELGRSEAAARARGRVFRKSVVYNVVVTRAREFPNQEYASIPERVVVYYKWVNERMCGNGDSMPRERKYPNASEPRVRLCAEMVCKVRKRGV